MRRHQPQRPLSTATRVACAVGLLAACASSPRVEVDRLAGAGLAEHTRFAVARDATEGDDPAFGPSARATAEEALIAELRARGLTRVPVEEAELVFHVHTATQSRLRGGGVSVAYPGGYDVYHRHSGVRTPVGTVPTGDEYTVVPRTGISVAEPVRETTSRVLVIDAVETQSERLVWRGTSTTRNRWARSIDLEDLRERTRAIAAEFP